MLKGWMLSVQSKQVNNILSIYCFLSFSSNKSSSGKATFLRRVQTTAGLRLVWSMFKIKPYIKLIWIRLKNTDNMLLLLLFRSWIKFWCNSATKLQLKVWTGFRIMVRFHWLLLFNYCIIVYCNKSIFIFMFLF